MFESFFSACFVDDNQFQENKRITQMLVVFRALARFTTSTILYLQRNQKTIKKNITTSLIRYFVLSLKLYDNLYKLLHYIYYGTFYLARDASSYYLHHWNNKNIHIFFLQFYDCYVTLHDTLYCIYLFWVEIYHLACRNHKYFK